MMRYKNIMGQKEKIPALSHPDLHHYLLQRNTDQLFEHKKKVKS